MSRDLRVSVMRVPGGGWGFDLYDADRKFSIGGASGYRGALEARRAGEAMRADELEDGLSLGWQGSGPPADHGA
jgi:hypothetical protein